MPAVLDLRQNTATTVDAPPEEPASPPVSSPRAASASEPRAGSVLEWDTLEYHLQPKSLGWYAVFGVAVAILLFIAFLMGSFLTGTVFTLVAVVILLYSERPPRTLHIQVHRDSLMIEDRVYGFADLESYHIIPSPNGNLLLLRSKRLVMPLLHVLLADQDSETVRQALLGRVTENMDLREPLPDLLAHRLGF